MKDPLEQAADDAERQVTHDSTGRLRTEREQQQARDLLAMPADLKEQVASAQTKGQKNRIIRTYLAQCERERRTVEPTPSPRQRRAEALARQLEQAKPSEPGEVT
jgi:hypothetical protein